MRQNTTNIRSKCEKGFGIKTTIMVINHALKAVQDSSKPNSTQLTHKPQNDFTPSIKQLKSYLQRTGLFYSIKRKKKVTTFLYHL